jgi:hypothetical protein
MKAEKIDPKIRENLFSANTDTVIAAIKEIKNRGNKLYIPILFDQLTSIPEREVENEIIDLLATVKNKDVIESYVSALTNEKYKSIKKTILTTCWQNGMDYSNYLPIFVDIIINDNWEVAFEAFTIIDNLEFLPEKEIIESSVIIIEDALKTADEQKTYLLQEVLKTIT